VELVIFHEDRQQEEEMTSGHATYEALVDALLKDYTDPQDILDEHGLLKQRTKRVVERAVAAELTAPLGSAPPARHGPADQNARNGTSAQTVQTDTGPWRLDVPRARTGRLLPRLVPKRHRRREGFDENVLRLYARGLSTRDIQGHLEDLDGTEVSPTRIASLTEALLDEGRTWPARPLAPVYPLLSFDAVCVTSRQEGAVHTQAVSRALGVTMDGEKARRGWWLSASEGAQC
jgi:transposase-like protein